MNSTNNRVTTPPSVIHQWADDRPFGQDAIDVVIDRVKANAKLTKNETSLLRFYAKCGGGKKGFPAALALVLKRTGIADEKGWRRSRRKLEKLNLITYRNDGRDHFIMVNWRNICEMAIPGNKLIKSCSEEHAGSSSLFQAAVKNMANQSQLSKKELAETVTLLSFLTANDWQKIASATIPQYRKYYFGYRKDKTA